MTVAEFIIEELHELWYDCVKPKVPLRGLLFCWHITWHLVHSSAVFWQLGVLLQRSYILTFLHKGLERCVIVLIKILTTPLSSIRGRLVFIMSSDGQVEVFLLFDE
jgi:hypothetical protein